MTLFFCQLYNTYTLVRVAPWFKTEITGLSLKKAYQ